MSEEQQPQPVTPATEGVAGLIAAAVEQTIAQLGDEQFAELVALVRQPAELPEPQGNRPPPRVPSEPTSVQQYHQELYGGRTSYPAAWGFQRAEGN